MERVRVIRIWTPGLGKKLVIFRLADYLVFYATAFIRVAFLPRQDVLIALTTPPFIVLAALLHRRLHPRPRVLLWIMDCYPEVAEMAGMLRPTSLVSRILVRLNRSIYRGVDGIVGLDGAMLRRIADRYGPASRLAPMRVIPNWERFSDFPAETVVPGVRPETASNFVVLYTGNAGEGHQFEDILEAADRLRDSGIRFLFVGGGKRMAQIDQTRRERRLENVEIQGYIPKERIPALMAGSHLGLITLRDAAVGLISPSKLHATLAAGLPVIYVGPTGSNVDEAIARTGCGYGFRTGDVDGIVRTLRNLQANPDEYGPRRRLARQAFEDHYCDRRTLPLFDAVIEGSPRSEPKA